MLADAPLHNHLDGNTIFSLRTPFPKVPRSALSTWLRCLAYRCMGASTHFSPSGCVVCAKRPNATSHISATSRWAHKGPVPVASCPFHPILSCLSPTRSFASSREQVKEDEVTYCFHASTVFTEQNRFFSLTQVKAFGVILKSLNCRLIINLLALLVVFD